MLNGDKDGVPLTPEQQAGVDLVSNPEFDLTGRESSMNKAMLVDIQELVRIPIFTQVGTRH